MAKKKRKKAKGAKSAKKKTKKKAKAKKKKTVKGRKKKTVKKKKTKAKKKKATKKKKTKAKKKKPAKKKKTKARKKTKAKKKKSKRKPNAAFMAPMVPSPELAEIVGSKALPRTQVVKKLWAYIKKKRLQDPNNRRNIRADAALLKVFRGKKVVSMFDMTKLVNKQLKAA